MQPWPRYGRYWCLNDRRPLLCTHTLVGVALARAVGCLFVRCDDDAVVVVMWVCALVGTAISKEPIFIRLVDSAGFFSANLLGGEQVMAPLASPARILRCVWLSERFNRSHAIMNGTRLTAHLGMFFFIVVGERECGGWSEQA